MVFDKKKKPETEKETATAAAEQDGCQAPVGEGVCGKPLAPGQTYVCAAHVRTN